MRPERIYQRDENADSRCTSADKSCPLLPVRAQAPEPYNTRDDQDEVGDNRRELKGHEDSTRSSGQKGPNIGVRSRKEDVIPEDSNDTARTKSPCAVPSGQVDDGYIDEGLKRVQNAN